MLDAHIKTIGSSFLHVFAVQYNKILINVGDANPLVIQRKIVVL